MGEKLRIVVIYSKARKESTYNCVKIFKEALQKENDVDLTEFTLPGDMPHICLGCFTCFEKGEEKYPHANSVQPMVSTILESDGVILSSPVYSLDATIAKLIRITLTAWGKSETSSCLIIIISCSKI